jgi:hypothetical protein
MLHRDETVAGGRAMRDIAWLMRPATDRRRRPPATLPAWLASKPLRFLAMVVALVAWVGGATAFEEDEHASLHVDCFEHGQVEELRGSQVEKAAPGAYSTDRDAGRHHACEFAGCVMAAAPPPVAVVPSCFRVARIAAAVAVRPGAPRGPPLAYAPKTSPPALVA